MHLSSFASLTINGILNSKYQIVWFVTVTSPHKLQLQLPVTYFVVTLPIAATFMRWLNILWTIFLSLVWFLMSHRTITSAYFLWPPGDTDVQAIIAAHFLVSHLTPMPERFHEWFTFLWQHKVHWKPQRNTLQCSTDFKLWSLAELQVHYFTHTLARYLILKRMLWNLKS